MKAISAPISLLVNELRHNCEQLAKRLLKGEVNPVSPTLLSAISSAGACPCTRALKSDAAAATGAREDAATGREVREIRRLGAGHQWRPPSLSGAHCPAR